MKTFLVPIDFSPNSVHAAKYAVALTSGTGAHIILYHVFSRISLATLTEDEQSRQVICETELNQVKDQLILPAGQTVSVESEGGTFVECLEKYVLGNKVDMVIMGITGSSRLKQVFMGTNTLSVIRHVSSPVMIIPPDAEYKGIRNVLFTSDFTDVARTTPFTALKEVIEFFGAKVHVLNVNSEHYIELSDAYRKEKEAMEDKLGQYDPEFSFLRSYDFLDGIQSYVESRDIDVIITVPRRHNYLSQLFKITHTKRLAYHSHIPTIAIPA